MMISSLQIAFLLCAFNGAATGPSTDDTYLLVAESSMVKVLPDVPLGDGPHRETVEFAVAGGEVEAAQIVIAPGSEPLRDVEFSVSELKGPDGTVLPKSAVTLSVMGYVQTDPEAKLAFPVEQSGWFPDPILPFVERFDVEKGKIQSLWLSVTCPPGQRAGFYSGRVTVSPANAEEQTIPVEVRVFGFDVPKKRSLPTATATFMDHPERIHGDSWNREMYWRYVDFLHAHRLNMDNIYRTGEDPPTLDDVKRLVAGGQDAWCLRFVRQPAKFGNERGEDPETYDEYVTTAIAEAKAAYEVFVEAGAADLCYIYIFDEVREKFYDTLKETARLVREALPGVTVVTSAFDLDYGIASGVSDVVEAWGAITFAFSTDEYLANIEKARANGDRVSWYVTFWPPDPYPNFLVEGNAIGARLLMGAMTQKFRPDGFGYWATTWWGGNDSPITRGLTRTGTPLPAPATAMGACSAPARTGRSRLYGSRISATALKTTSTTACWRKRSPPLGSEASPMRN